ncbi:MAG: hypothetical protein EPN57_01900 [Paraburkholderia sp.]|nr:MAG: hypothetical protein EPN57_01900 [Paraburkholderia sp.]
MPIIAVTDRCTVVGCIGAVTTIESEALLPPMVAMLHFRRRLSHRPLPMQLTGETVVPVAAHWYSKYFETSETRVALSMAIGSI